MGDLFIRTFGSRRAKGRRAGLKSPWRRTGEFGGGARGVSGPRRAMTGWRSGGGSRYRCGGLRSISSMHPGGWNVRARGGGGADAVERREASPDDGDDGLSGTLGTAIELAGEGVSDQLGGRVPVGRVVAFGSGAWRIANCRGWSRWGWTRSTGATAYGPATSSP